MRQKILPKDYTKLGTVLQLHLPMDIEFSIPKDNPVWLVRDGVERMDLSKLYGWVTMVNSLLIRCSSTGPRSSPSPTSTSLYGKKPSPGVWAKWWRRFRHFSWKRIHLSESASVMEMNCTSGIWRNSTANSWSWKKSRTQFSSTFREFEMFFSIFHWRL